MGDTILLGVDPGTRITGYALLQVEPLRVLDYGCIRPPTKAPIEKRYLILYESLTSIIEKHQPSALVTETQFVQKNVQSAIKLGMARGMALLAAAKRGVPFFEYTPKEAKKAVVGTGTASKRQVQYMVMRLLSLSKLPEPEDAADALALALCHSHTLRSRCLPGLKER